MSRPHPDEPRSPSPSRAGVAVGSPPPPAAAAAIFAAALPKVVRYADLLAETGVRRGLIGPREVPRLWERHLLNCAVLAPLVARAASCADVGSGAGLPGLVVALVRPDLRVRLVEPSLRRCAFLSEAVGALALSDRVTVDRARAQERAGIGVDVVLARAVAPLERLIEWTAPLLRPGGELLALKGARADQELAAAGPALRAAGAVSWHVETRGDDVLETPASVVRVRMSRVGPGPARRRPARRR